MTSSSRNTEAELRQEIGRLKMSLAEAERNLRQLMSDSRDGSSPIKVPEPDATSAWPGLAGSEQEIALGRLLFQDHPQPMWIYDPATLKFLDVNQAATRHYGYSRAEFLGMTLADIRLADDSDKLFKTVSQLRMGVNFLEGCRHRAKDGRIIIAEITSRTISLAGREAMLVHALDVTEFAKAAEALRSQATMLDNAQKIGRMGTWHLDMKTNRLIWSDSTCALFGITQAEFNGTYEHFCSFILPEDLPACFEAQKRATPAAPLQEAEYRIRRPDGAVRWMYECGNIEHDSAGNVLDRIGMVIDITDQRVTREKVEQGAALLRLAGRVAKIGGWLIEYPEGKLIWSDEVCQIHDMPPGSHPALAEGLAMFPPEDRGIVMSSMEACLNSGIPYDIEVTKRTATGRLIRVRSIGEAVRDEHGAIIRLQGAFQDVTERKQVELHLASSNRALRLLSRCTEAVIRASDEQQLLSEICKLAVETGGYRMAWVGYVQHDEARSIKPMAHAGFEDGYLEVAKLNWDENHPAGRGPAGECIRIRKLKYCPNIADGGDFVYWRDEALKRGYRNIICLPLIENDTSIGVLGLYADLPLFSDENELRLLQELADDLAFGITSLRVRAERFQSAQKIAQQAELIDKATDAIILSDLKGTVLLWSKGAERIYGWEASEMIGVGMNECYFPDIFAYHDAITTLRKNGEWRGELQKSTKRGQSILVDCRWALMNDNAGGTRQAVFAIETDITEKKKLELQFLRSQRMESLGTLAGGIAHDLNNILSPIMISIQMLSQEVASDEMRDVLKTLQLCSERGAKLVRQVLSFARGAEGKRVLTDFCKIVEELRAVVIDTFPKNIKFNFIFGAGIPLVAADPTQLHQVLLNLCVNSRDAMPGGGELSIGLSAVNVNEPVAGMNPGTRPEPYVLVTVTDTGDGMPPQVRERIFEPFYTTKEFGKGTGLGLSTVLGIVKSHGGFVNVESVVHKGTTFKVYFPAAKSASSAVAKESRELKAQDGDGRWVLLVDDEESIRKILKKTLESRGFQTLSACNGAEALSLYRQHQQKISLVITDISMPVMDGSALIEALTQMSPSVHIIASSGMSAEARIRDTVNAGRIVFVSKPYSTEVLLGAISSATARTN
jgi:PAS domain S-box-containing protein